MSPIPIINRVILVRRSHMTKAPAEVWVKRGGTGSSSGDKNARWRHNRCPWEKELQAKWKAMKGKYETEKD